MLSKINAMLKPALFVLLLLQGAALQAAQSPAVKQPQVDTPKLVLFVGNLGMKDPFELVIMHGSSFDYYGKEDAAFLRKVADETVQKFFGR